MRNQRVRFCFFFPTSPNTILSYDLKKGETNICKHFSLRWDLGVIGYGAKQGTTHENHPHKLSLVTFKHG